MIGALCVHVSLIILSEECVSISQCLLRIVSSIRMTVVAFAGPLSSLSQFSFTYIPHTSDCGKTPVVAGGRTICSCHYRWCKVIKRLRHRSSPLSWNWCDADCWARCEVEGWDSELIVARTLMPFSLSSMVLMRVESAVWHCRRSAGCKLTVIKETYIWKCTVAQLIGRGSRERKSACMRIYVDADMIQPQCLRASMVVCILWGRQ